ncbi:MAG TPA: DUF6456 domain-containing protein [Pelagibacterium sp.]|uniref:DUF6456 domain-containing protein n=1 Tax=Pelagibacterium sp. TaxID=1967288 RepID=UPI002C68A313|nr:DUF6456 domain-containing protein [Pelagibacterium sp.]HWJ87658.1 DUF6456 domain-containing protein [Pelagibacterium sp.]
MSDDSVLKNDTLRSLARHKAGLPGFLQPHHLEAGQRIQVLFERSQLQPRTTMYYGPRVGGNRGGAGAHDIGDMAADARRKLAEIWKLLPSDCAGVLIDVCGFDKGLQQVEVERRWPRRSAKLVLRIGLEAAARHFGLTSDAVGLPATGNSNWMEASARPSEFG